VINIILWNWFSIHSTLILSELEEEEGIIKSLLEVHAIGTNKVLGAYS
jgi:hypothetical protein